MNVLIVGAHGQIGQHLVDLLKEEGQHNPIAFVRSEDQIKQFQDKGVEARLGNLEDSIDEIKKSLTDIDAVVFSAGSGGSTGADKTLLVDLDGAVKVMEATKASGIKRFLIVSAFGAGNRDRFSDQIKPYYVAKHFADQWLIDKTDLDYTIIRPGLLSDEDSKDTVRLEYEITDAEDNTVPRIDVARVIAASLDNDSTVRKAFDLVSGSDQIEDALNKL